MTLPFSATSVWFGNNLARSVAGRSCKRYRLRPFRLGARAASSSSWISRSWGKRASPKSAGSEGKNEPRARRGERGANGNACKTIPTADRVRLFPNQTLIAENDKVICEACGRRPLSKMKHTIRANRNRKTHKEAVEAFLKSQRETGVCVCV